MANRILPLELIDKAIGSQLWILMRGKTEVVGTLRVFDDYVSFALWSFAQWSWCGQNLSSVAVWHAKCPELTHSSFLFFLKLNIGQLGSGWRHWIYSGRDGGRTGENGIEEWNLIEWESDCGVGTWGCTAGRLVGSTGVVRMKWCSSVHLLFLHIIYWWTRGIISKGTCVTSSFGHSIRSVVCDVSQFQIKILFVDAF